MVNKMDFIHQLADFGLDKSEAKAYLTLLEKGSLTPLVLSRETGINRTTLYRILEKLVKVGLVKELLKYKSTSYQANSPESLNILLTQKKIEVKELEKKADLLMRELQSILPTRAYVPTKALYYQGSNGLRQLLWNTLRARDEVVGFGYGDWNKGIGKKFAEKIRLEYVDRNIYSKEILNEDQIDSTFSYTQIKDYPRKHYEHRAISKHILTIHHDAYIYNDVFAFYHIYQGELFGVEIYNAEITKTQRQIFYLLWKHAKKLR